MPVRYRISFGAQIAYRFCGVWRAKPHLEVGSVRAFGSVRIQSNEQETEMSKSIKLFAMVGLLAAVAACAQQEEEFVVVEPEPISTEPTFTGKYK